MSGAENKNPAVVFFIDCLREDEAKACSYLGEHVEGTIESGVPRVTPQVLGGISTGKKPTHHGLLCPTKLYGEGNLSRPYTETIYEELGRDYRVLNYEMPFSANLRAKHLTNIGSAPTSRTARPGVFQLPGPGGKLWEEEPDKTVQSHIDHVRSIMSVTRNLMRQGTFDILFISIRNVDSFGHFLFKEQRANLIDYIDYEIGETEKMGDMSENIMFFSDHGITEKESTFYINRWLIEKGYLKVNVLYDKWERLNNPDGEGLKQLSVHSPYVEVDFDNSQVVSPDAFDSQLKILDDSLDVESFRDEIMSTGFYDGIWTPTELYGHGDFEDQLGCDLVVDRADGVLVSGNVHKELSSTGNEEIKCQGELRTGVHTRQGVWGANGSVESDDYKPHDYHHVLKSQIRDVAPKPDKSQLYGLEESKKSMSEDEQNKIEDRLKALGYM